MRPTLFNSTMCEALFTLIGPSGVFAKNFRVQTGERNPSVERPVQPTREFRNTSDRVDEMKKPAKVQVKELATREVGSHYHDEQLSTPGLCEWPDRSPD